MARSEQEVLELTRKVLDAWNGQDVEAVLDRYTEDVIYRDPNTRGTVSGREAMGRYLTKLFAAWEMNWSMKEFFPLGDEDGGAFLWRASLRRPGGEDSVEVDGMDLVLLRGDRISRNEVYFDRAVLAPLLGGPTA